MQSEAPLTLILSPLLAGRGELERTLLGSLFCDPHAVPTEGSPLPFEKGEGQGGVCLNCMDTIKGKIARLACLGSRGRSRKQAIRGRTRVSGPRQEFRSAREPSGAAEAT